MRDLDDESTIEDKNNNLKFNKNLFVSSVIYNNPEIQKLQILTENKNKAGIYLFTHLDTQKSYVGSSANLSRRFTYYFSKVNISRNTKSRIHNALLLYGYSSFSLTILEYIEITNLPREEAKKIILGREQYFLGKILPEYNILKTAGSLLGFKHSNATILKFQDRINSKNPMFGKLHSIETKQKLSELKKGKLRSEETKKKIGKTNSKKVFVYQNDPLTNKRIFLKCIDIFSESAEYFNCSYATIKNYVNKDKLLKNKWLLLTSYEDSSSLKEK